MRWTRRSFVRRAGGMVGAAWGVAELGVGRAPAFVPGLRDYRACVIGRTGGGNYGHGLDLAFQKIPGVRVAAVADPDAKGRTRAVQRAGAERGYEDWREMLRVEKPDLVSIGPRWVEERLEMVSAAAEVQAHVYMEKPMAASLQEADRILAVAERAGIRIVVAHQVMLAPGLVDLKRRIDDGLIGEVLELRTRGKEDHRAGGEDLMVLGTHCMYLMRYFGGSAEWCEARVTQDGREVTAADRREATEPLGPVAGDTIQASYAFPGGLQGFFASSKVPRGEGGRFQLRIHGSRGQVIIHIGQDPAIYHLDDRLWSPGKTGSGWRPLDGAPSNATPSGLTGQAAANHRIVESLLRWVEGGEEPPVSGREARSALEMILAVYAAHLAKGRVALPLKERRHPLTLG